MVELKEGNKVGGFTVKGTLGKGGMGVVYLVRDPQLDIERALKVISFEREGSGRSRGTRANLEFRERFLREARTLARLRHPHIVPVHAVSEHEGHPYLVMTHFPSKDARRWLEDDQPQLDEVKLVATQLASALHYAHSRGVIHRDIKLSNILIQTPEHRRALHPDAAVDGELGGGRAPGPSVQAASADPDDVFEAVQAKAAIEEAADDEDDGGVPRVEAMLIDFGLAKTQGDSDLTTTGRNMGTYAYLAPEYCLASDSALKPRHTVLTDLWALGCVLYGLTCHTLPFAGADDMSLFNRIIHGEFPRPESIRTDASPEWIKLISDLMAVDPRKRIQSAKELLRRLNSIESALDPRKPPFIPEPSVVEEVGEMDEHHAPAPDALNPGERPPTRPEGARAARPCAVDPLVATKIAAMVKLPPLEGVDGIVRPARPDSRPEIRAEKKESGGMLSIAGAVGDAAPRVDDGRAVHGVDAAGERAGAVLKERPKEVVRGDPDGEALNEARVIANAAPPTPAARANPSLVPAPAPRAAPTRDEVSPRSYAMKKLALPFIAAGGVVCLGAMLVFLTSSARAEQQSASSSFVDPDEVRRQQRSDAELRELEIEKERERRARSLAVVVVPPSLATPAGSGLTPASPAAPAPAAVGDDVPARRPRSAARPVIHVEPSPADEFTARYGARTDFNHPTRGPSPTASSAAVTSDAPTAGVRVPVRVADAIASSPTGPVIAVVTQATRIGSLTLAPGTQVHGQTAGTSGPRLLINFTFAIVDGKNVPLRGTALGLDARAGVPGTRSLGGPSDVAAGGAQGGAQGAVDAVSGAIENSIVGSAVRGAGGPGASKLGRINNEEEIVTSPRGARFFVYVESR